MDGELASGRKRILLTGATGYVGGRLLARLETAGYRVRCLARRPAYLQSRVGEATEVCAGDLLDRESLDAAMGGCDVAYYLVHSMGSAGSFEEEDRTAAKNFAEAARAAGVKRIVYLGGLGDSTQPLSSHLRSRQEVGRMLAESGVPTLEFRASIVIGSGSLSFEMIRALVDRLPVLVTPRWVSVPAQPIAVEDLLDYLVAGIALPLEGSQVFEIGGVDQASYGDLMREYARQRGLHRLIIPVPVLTPRLSGLWLGLVTPLFARVGRKLIDGIRFPTVVRDDSARRHFDLHPVGYREAIAAALTNEGHALPPTRWADSVSSSGLASRESARPAERRLVDARSALVATTPMVAFAAIERMGGATGWYWGNWLWRLRGSIDLICGGVGMRRGRRHPERLEVGDTVDFWRVVELERGRRVRLSAEMKLPGRAWLEFEVVGGPEGTRVQQIATFEPDGFRGLAYWYLIAPVHKLVFQGMLRGIVKAASLQGALPHNILEESA